MPRTLMNGTQLLQLHHELITQARELMSRKNADYTGRDATDNDALANFRMASSMDLCSLPQSVLIRLTDKVKRLATSTNRELQVKDEGVRDTVMDLINYAVLFYAAHLETQEARRPEAPGQAPSEPVRRQCLPLPRPASEESSGRTLRELDEARRELERRAKEYATRSAPHVTCLNGGSTQPPTLPHADTGQLVPYTGLASDSCQDER